MRQPQSDRSGIVTTFIVAASNRFGMEVGNLLYNWSVDVAVQRSIPHPSGSNQIFNHSTIYGPVAQTMNANVISSLFTNSPTISILPDIPHRLEQIRLAILAFPTERQNQREPILGELEVLARELARPQEDRIDLVLQRSWRIVTEFLGDHLSIRETASYLEPHGIHLP